MTDGFATLRELDLRVKHMEQMLDVKLRNIETKFTEHDRALKLQAAEYDRRLTELNHAHEKAQQDRTEDRALILADRQQFLRIEAWEGFKEKDESEKKAIAQALAIREGVTSGSETTRNIVIGLAGVLATVLFVVLAVVKL